MTKAALLACIATAGGILDARAGFPAGGATNNPAPARSFVEGELLVRFNENAPDHQLEDALNRAAGDVHKHVQTRAMAGLGHPGITHVLTRMPVEQAVRALQNHPGVVSVEPNYVYEKQQSAGTREG